MKKPIFESRAVYHNKTTLLLFISCAFTLPACISLSKKDQEQNIATMPKMTKSVEDSLATSYFVEGEWPKEAWWEVFQSKELNSLIEKALKMNPSLQAVEKRVLAAKEAAHVIRGKLYPLIFFDADETWSHLSKNGIYRTLNPSISPSANLIDLTLSFTYQFDFWSKNRNLFRAAVGEAKASIAESKEVELIITTGIAQSYFALKTDLILERLYKNLVQVRLDTLRLQNLLFEKALVSVLPPLLSEENFLEVKKELSAIQDEIATNKHLVNILVGVGPDEPLEVDDNLPSLDAIPIPKNLSIDLLARRPDLMAQIWKVEALAHTVGAARADFLPDINLAAFMGLESLGFSKLFRGSSQTEGLSPAIHLPLFTAGAILANVRSKKAAFDQAVYEYNNLILRSAQEVTDILAFAKAAFEREKEQEGIVRAAKARFNITKLRQEMGLDSFLEIYSIQDEVLRKLIDDARLIYDKLLAYVKLIKALGGGYDAEKDLPLKSQEKRQE